MKQLKDVPEGNKGKGLSKLPTAVRNKMGFKTFNTCAVISKSSH